MGSGLGVEIYVPVLTHPHHKRPLYRISSSRVFHTVLLAVTPAASCFHIRAARLLAFNRNPLSQRSRPGKVRPRLPNESPTPSLPPTPPRRPQTPGTSVVGVRCRAAKGVASQLRSAFFGGVIPHMTRAPPTVAAHGAKRSPSVRHLRAEVASPLYGS